MENLYLIAFEANERRSAVLDPAAYFAPSKGGGETAALPGAWCLVCEPRAAESDDEA